ncbi:putative TBC1 domain family member 8B-like [Sesbania bispinosa]|nr:putative TBC1 domain family member 8B-like [Sesbania bispinosa]
MVFKPWSIIGILDRVFKNGGPDEERIKGGGINGRAKAALDDEGHATALQQHDGATTRGKELANREGRGVRAVVSHRPRGFGL